MNSNPAPGTPPDPLKKLYHQSVVDHPRHRSLLSARHAALLAIDLQYLDAARGEGLFQDRASLGLTPEAEAYYFDQLEGAVLPNVRRLQDTFRLYGLEVIHTRIQSLTRDGRDRSGGHKRLHLHAPPGSREADFIEQVAPQDDEIVINKTASGVFSSTNLHYVLNNIGIEALFIAGVYTNECVETTARDACDLGYAVTVVADACATVTPGLHEATLSNLRDRYARILNTEQAITEVERTVG